MIGSLRVIATPEPMASLNVCASPSPSKADSKSDSRIPFLAAGDSEGDAWPQHLSMTKEAQEFVAQIEGPICVLVCMGQQGTDKVRQLSARLLHCIPLGLSCSHTPLLSVVLDASMCCELLHNLLSGIACRVHGSLC